jgi:D-alanyl-D-alanine carboxypeptidase
VHRSKPLLDTLRRFDAYSNNDIERLGDSLGTPAEMATHVAEALALPAESVQLQTISGLGTNRMTPRFVVKMLRHLRTTCERLGLSIESVLPVAGCDPGTLNHSFARLCTGPCKMSMVAKTGTLTYTDGGAAVLAGFVNTGRARHRTARGRVPARRRSVTPRATRRCSIRRRLGSGWPRPADHGQGLVLLRIAPAPLVPRLHSFPF